MDSKDINKTNEASLDPRKQWVKFVVATVLYLLFLYWVGSWWGLVVIPFIYDAYISKKIPWTWWKKSKNKTFVWIMGWVDAIVFALVAVYFVNQFFFQNYVIPSFSERRCGAWSEPIVSMIPSATAFLNACLSSAVLTDGLHLTRLPAL